MPSEIYITEEGTILSEKPAGKTIIMPDVSQSAEYQNLNEYDDTPPTDEKGDTVQFQEKKPTGAAASDDPNSKENKALARYETIIRVKSTWEERSNGDRKHDADLRKELMAAHEVSYSVLGNILHMSDERIQAVWEKAHPESTKAPFSNMIYKVLDDGVSARCIYQYVLEQGYSGSPLTLRDRIADISLYNGFGKIPKNEIFKYRDLPEGVYRITVSRIVEWMTAIDEKIIASMENSAVARYILLS